MHIFYTPEISDSKLLLSEEESKHCVNVLRMKTGDDLILVDGIGGYYEAKITNPHPKRCEVEINNSQKEYQKRNFQLHIACAPTKNNERFEWFLEKATEIGIDAITPLQCEHSERNSIKAERLEKVIVSAMKQSIKAYKPILHPSIDFKKLLDGQKNFSGQKFIAHCYVTPKKTLPSIYEKGKDVLILIGPEGDFSKTEVDLAEASGFISVSLSSSRLRTETAALAACHTFNLLNGV